MVRTTPTYPASSACPQLPQHRTKAPMTFIVASDQLGRRLPEVSTARRGAHQRPPGDPTANTPRLLRSGTGPRASSAPQKVTLASCPFPGIGKTIKTCGPPATSRQGLYVRDCFVRGKLARSVGSFMASGHIAGIWALQFAVADVARLRHGTEAVAAIEVPLALPGARRRGNSWGVARVRCATHPPRTYAPRSQCRQRLSAGTKSRAWSTSGERSIPMRR